MAFALHWMAIDPLNVIRRMPRAYSSDSWSATRELRFRANDLGMSASVIRRTGMSGALARAGQLLGLMRSASRKSKDRAPALPHHALWSVSSRDAGAQLSHWSIAAHLEELDVDWRHSPLDIGYGYAHEMELSTSWWNSIFIRTLNDWVSEEEAIPQDQFWTVFGAAAGASKGYWTVPSSLCLCEGDSELALFGFRDVVGLEHWPHSEAKWDLSGRRVRVILSKLARELERLDFSGPHGVTDLQAYLQLLARSLLLKVLIFVRRRVLVAREDRGTFASRTYDQVRRFVIHTGVSPPALAVEHSAVGRMLAVIPEQWRFSDVPNRRRKTSRNLRNALFRRRAKARFCGRAQSYALVDCSGRSSGRWGDGCDRAFAGHA